MITLRVEVEEEKDLSVLRKVLTELGFKFSFDEKEHVFESLSDAAIYGIQQGLNDLENGRVYSHDDVKSRLNDKISEMRVKYAGQ
jgi:hypothetical protein